MAEQSSHDGKEEGQIITTIEKHVERYYSESECEVSRIKHNIWSIKENEYVINIIVTSMLIIFDTELFNQLPKEKNLFFEELLHLNAHLVRSAKLCLVKNQIHMRMLRGLIDFGYSEFAAHIDEFRELHPEICDKLIGKYYSTSES